MDATSTVLAIVLAVICLASAGADFARVPRVVQSLEHLNVPTRIMPVLGAIKVVGALGLFIGLGADWLGSAAAAGFVLYFLAATGLHLRARDAVANLAPAAVLLVLSAATFLTSL